MKFKYLLLILVLALVLTGCEKKKIVLNEESNLVLEVGDEKTIDYNVIGSDEETYLKSSDSEIVSIIGDRIIALKEGNVVINIFFKDNDKSFASFNVVVNLPINEKNITINYDDILSLKINEEKILEYIAINSEEDVILSTSNSEIILVEGNKIIAKSIGNAVISFSFKNDSTVYATVNIEVIKTENIICSEEIINLEVMDEYVLLYQIVNSEQKVEVISSNEAIVKIEGNKLIALTSGTVEVSLKFVNEDKIYSTVQIVVKEKPLVKEINIEEETISLVEGSEYEVNYLVINSESEVEMISSNSEIVSVVGNKIIANKKGDANISIKFVDDETIYNNIIVIVSEPEKKILILNEELELSLFSSLQILVKLEYIDDVIYEISNTDIATVSNTGLITPIKEGDFILYIKDANDISISVSIALNVMVDPFEILDMAHIERPITQYVSSYGYNPDIRYQWVYGSVSSYSTMNLNLVENIVDITDNIYKKTTATPEKLTVAEGMKLVRSGILHEKTEYITYHDTGNHTPGANAQMHGNYMVGADNKNNRARSWHYTVDENQVIHHIPDNEVSWQGDSYTAYAKSIGVETCVDFGSDLYKTWQRTGKLMAGLLVKHDLELTSIKQHYDWNQKNCPQTLRMNNLYKVAMGMVEAEYNVLKYLEGYNIEYVSLNPEYVDNTGKIIKLPSKPMRVGYKAIVTNPKGLVSEKVYYSYLKLEDGSTLNPILTDIELANNFDNKVWAIEEITYNVIDPLVNEYLAFSDEVKDLVLSYSLLQSYEIGLMEDDQFETPVLIYEVLPDGNSSDIKNSYIMLYNTTKNDFILKDKYLIIYNNTVNFSLDGLIENKDWYKFNDDAVIKPYGYYLIQTSNIESEQYSSLADAAVDLDVSSNIVLVLADELKDISEKQDIVIDLLVTNQEAVIGHPIVYNNTNKAISRKYFMDTNDCRRDFEFSNPKPINSNNDYSIKLSIDQKQALVFDTSVRFLDKILFMSDSDDINNLISLYDLLTVNQKKLIKLGDLYNTVIMRWNVVNNPDLRVISDAVEQIPNQIINDFILPSHEGLTYSYSTGQDSSYYNLETGEYLKVSYEYKPIIVTLSYKDITYDITINFGVAKDTETVIYVTGPKTTGDDGATASGAGTYEDQLNSVGFDNVAIKVDSKVYIIGEKAYIPVNGTCIMNQLGLDELRPYGIASGDDVKYNQGLIRGIATGYKGTGVLYENISDAILSLDPSDTYGRNNAGVYGYFKIIFSLNVDGTYTVSEILNNSGTNNTTNGDKISLEPGQMIWAPHTYETNVKGGTWLMNGGLGGSTGVLIKNKIIEVIKFNK